MISNPASLSGMHFLFGNIHIQSNAVFGKGPSINDVTSFSGNFDPASPLVIPCHDFEYPPL